MSFHENVRDPLWRLMNIGRCIVKREVVCDACGARTDITDTQILDYERGCLCPPGHAHIVSTIIGERPEAISSSGLSEHHPPMGVCSEGGQP